MKLHRFCLLLVLAACACTGAPPGPGDSDAPAESRAALRGGTVVTEPSPVVSIYHDETFMCSGTLVGPRVVVTAAHCLESRDQRVTIRGFAAPTEGLLVSDFEWHPGYRTRGWPDLAVLALATASADVPFAALPPSPPTLTLEVGSSLELTGFGRTVSGEEPTERRGTAVVVGVGPEELSLAGDGCAPCFGDSGGPVLLSAGDQRVLIGVIATGNAECSGTFRAARVDTPADQVVAPFLGRLGQTGAPDASQCVDDASCESGICSDYGLGRKVCARPCSSDGRCLQAERCLLDAGRHVCAPDVVFGALGSPCAADADCRSGVCPQSAGERRCAVACSPTDRSPCPSGFSCVANDTEPEPFLCEAATPSNERAASCALTGSHRPTGRAECAAWLALALALVSRRRLARA